MFIKGIVWFFPHFSVFMFILGRQNSNIWNKEFWGRTFIRHFLSFKSSFYHKGTLHHLIAKKESYIGALYSLNISQLWHSSDKLLKFIFGHPLFKELFCSPSKYKSSHFLNTFGIDAINSLKWPISHYKLTLMLTHLLRTVAKLCPKCEDLFLTLFHQLMFLTTGRSQFGK